MSIIAMIPARMGSTRLEMKNLALINGKPLIFYAIEAAKDSGVFDRVVINSEDTIFGDIAKRYDVEFYKRPSEHASSTAKSDSVVYDFMLNNPSDITAWVNPISPLQTGEEVKNVINYFVKENLDTLITVKDEQVHCLYDGKPVNFNENEVFAQTQDLIPMQRFVYSIMMWKNKAFIDTFEKKGYALFSGKVGYYPVSKESAVIIKTQEDLMVADAIMKAKQGGYELQYDEVVKGLKEA
ncbi:MAG: hypothetical protein FVQ80_00465 [Planctomycetes bacterium]|nr:hypothetical protein [Planctomycetota bacterium]